MGYKRFPSTILVPTGEVYDHSTTIVNSCFSIIIAENVLANPDPKTITECKRRSD
jgi:hypothetical protein